MCSTPKFVRFLILLALLLAGCAPGSATLIASYPHPSDNSPRPLPTALNNSSRLSLEVDDVSYTAGQAIDLAQSYGGWVIDRYCRGEGADQVANLILAVPASAAERLRRTLTSLGQVIDQTTWTGDARCITCAETSYIYLELAPHPPAWVDAPPATPRGQNWSPALTLQHAWQVTAGIFTFLLDGLIWIAVVAGPFVLIGLGILYLVRRARHKNLSEK
jgi:hypothetical protein